MFQIKFSDIILNTLLGADYAICGEDETGKYLVAWRSDNYDPDQWSGLTVSEMKRDKFDIAFSASVSISVETLIEKRASRRRPRNPKNGVNFSAHYLLLSAEEVRRILHEKPTQVLFNIEVI